jgi:hypothetical protein
MSNLFPYANHVLAAALLVLGLGFHFLGQLVSVMNWPFATRIGLQEKQLAPDQADYEYSIAVADVSLGWLYGLAAVGLATGAEWGYLLAIVPGSILLYHAIFAWVCEGRRRKAGQGLWSDAFRITWCGANALTACLALAVGWAGPVA